MKNKSLLLTLGLILALTTAPAKADFSFWKTATKAVLAYGATGFGITYGLIGLANEGSGDTTEEDSNAHWETSAIIGVACMACASILLATGKMQSTKLR